MIGQAVFLNPGSVASLVIAVPSLENVILEDSYTSSIWGPRLRVSDVLLSSAHLDENDPRKERISAVVECTARLERIVGGDRGI